MVYAWAFAAPFSFVIVRYYKHHSDWLHWHQLHDPRCLVPPHLYPVFVGEIVFEKLADRHALIGVIILTLSCLQFILGSVTVAAMKANKAISHQRLTQYRRCSPSPHPRRYPFAMRFISSVDGSLLSYVARLSCGLIFLFAFRSLQRVLLAAVKKCGANRIFKSLEDICVLKFLPSYTQQEFRSKYNRSRWVIVGNQSLISRR